MIVVESPEKIVDLLSSSGTFSPRHLGGGFKCSSIVSVHNLFFIPIFNCVLIDRLKLLSAQFFVFVSNF